MKKIFLIIILLLCTSCYDYTEINDIAVISGIGIDYVSDEYLITLEVLNSNTSKEDSIVSSYTVEGSSATIADAINKASSKINKKAIYSHVKLMIISDTVRDEKLESITDYFLRSTYFRENFYLISSDISPDIILNTKDEANLVVSDALINLLESNYYDTNEAVLKTFDTIISEITTYGIDTAFSNITIDDNNFVLNGINIYHNYQYITTLDNEYALIYNILTGSYERPIIRGKNLSIYLLDDSYDIEMDNTIHVTGVFSGKIASIEDNYDIRDLSVIDSLNEEITTLLNAKIKDFLKVLQDNNSDILGISKSYYNKTRYQNDTLWTTLPLDINIRFNISKKGLIYNE